MISDKYSELPLNALFCCFLKLFLGFDPWNESRKALADLIEEETVNHTENRNASLRYQNSGVTSPHSLPTGHSNCIPTQEEMVRSTSVLNW